MEWTTFLIYVVPITLGLLLLLFLGYRFLFKKPLTPEQMQDDAEKTMDAFIKFGENCSEVHAKYINEWNYSPEKVVHEPLARNSYDKAKAKLLEAREKLNTLKTTLLDSDVFIPDARSVELLKRQEGAENLCRECVRNKIQSNGCLASEMINNGSVSDSADEE